jgi:hypothetical protein
MTLEEVLEELNEDALLLEPRSQFDPCICGVGARFNDGPLATYDVDKVLDSLASGGMSEEEAQEYFDVNIAGAWVGEGTPMFVRLIEKG